MKKRLHLFCAVFVLCILPMSKTNAKQTEWYVSWGYSKDYWRPSDIHVSQASLGNDFVVHGVQASDYPQWDEGAFIFDKAITDPEYNFRFGYFFDEARSWAWEINFDHSKYNTNADQLSHITGTIAGAPVDMVQQLTGSYFRYNLHNGANHILLNLVKRFSLLGELNDTGHVSFLGKFGAGIMLPHADNTIMNKTNDVGGKIWGNYVGWHQGWWQIGGWTTGLEAGVRVVVYKPIYIEFTDKEAYASLSHIPVYAGTADHTLWMNELVLSVGYTFEDTNTQQQDNSHEPQPR